MRKAPESRAAIERRRLEFHPAPTAVARTVPRGAGFTRRGRKLAKFFRDAGFILGVDELGDGATGQLYAVETEEQFRSGAAADELQRAVSADEHDQLFRAVRERFDPSSRDSEEGGFVDAFQCQKNHQKLKIEHKATTDTKCRSLTPAITA